MKAIYVTEDIGYLVQYFNAKVNNRYDVVELADFIYWQFGSTPAKDPFFISLKSGIFLIKLKMNVIKFGLKFFL